jgi:hypothetical protein
MIGAGFLDGMETDGGGLWIHGLTWEGHEVLELIRDRWETIKRVLDDANCYNFEFIQQISRRLIE